jgi:hypothetical protein
MATNGGVLDGTYCPLCMPLRSRRPVKGFVV